MQRHVPSFSRIPLLVALLLTSIAACGGGERASDTDTGAAPADSPAVTHRAASRVSSDSGFMTPESVLWDSAGGVWFVSNINGTPAEKDNNGFISRLGRDGTVDSMRFIAGRRGGPPLHAPKGMALRGNELWVSDIDAVHVFDRTTGAHLSHYDLRARAAVFLNDVAMGPDGSIYITDTGIRFGASGPERAGPDRVYKIDPNTRSITVALQSDSSLGHPNGITWDATGNRFIIVPFGAQSLHAWTPDDSTTTTIASGPGEFDGVEVTRDGRILVSSWADSSVWSVTGNTPTKVITGVPAPADIGLDRQGNRVGIPLFMSGRVEIWELGTP